MPTLTASAPESMSACVASAVGDVARHDAHRVRQLLDPQHRVQHALGMPVRGIPRRRGRRPPRSAARRARGRRRRRWWPRDAQASWASLAALGLSWLFSMSLTVIRPTQLKPASTTSSFSMRRWCRSRLASSGSTLSRTVTRFSRVISSETFWSGSEAKRTSRLVRMPTSRPVFWPPLPPFSTTGIPEMPCARISARASASVASGPMVTGLTTMPDSNFLTCRTCSACSAGVKLRWMTPMPPACAMAMASRASVTVSMAAEMIGILRSMSPAMRVRMSVSPGITSEWPGCRRTSSKVSASGPVTVSMILAMPSPPSEKAGARHARPRRPESSFPIRIGAGC